MPLETIEQVTAAIRAITEGPVPRGLRPAERQLRAGTLADLYDVRGSLWRDLGVKARGSKRVPNAYAAACAVAEKHDRDEVKFWRGEASAR